MRFDTLVRHLTKFHFEVTIGPSQGRRLYDFILQQRPRDCLELGFAHGTSSCYIAAALDELGAGHLTSVDLEQAREWQKPSIEELLAETGLAPYVTVARERTSYNWFLKKRIEAQTTDDGCEPCYDFCFIDGAKHWTIDGFAFFLVDKLLRDGGWVLFDDLYWSRRRLTCEAMDYISFLPMGEDERDSAHIDLVFRLLVLQHPDYVECRIENNAWAWARKRRNSAVVVKTLVMHERTLRERLQGVLLRRRHGLER
ncbi:MAG TPA: class I SAM-dependent methyltransferase [Burkholderiales bacterium]